MRRNEHKDETKRDCLSSWQEREAEERECDEKSWNCFELNQWIHGSTFFSPLG